MPRRNGIAVAEEVGYSLPGLYAWLLLREQSIRMSPDPRELWRCQEQGLPRSAAANCRDGLGVPLDDLLAGHPVVVRRGTVLAFRPELRRSVEMFTDPANVRFQVTSRDRVTVAAQDYGSAVLADF